MGILEVIQRIYDSVVLYPEGVGEMSLVNNMHDYMGHSPVDVETVSLTHYLREAVTSAGPRAPLGITSEK